MKVFDRLLLELSNQQYLSEVQYKQILIENDLNPNEEFEKTDMYKKLLFAVLDIFDAVMNDVDTMSNISTEFTDIGQAYGYLEARAQKVRDKIAAIPDPTEDYTNFSLMFTRGGRPAWGGHIHPINRATIDKIIEEELGGI